MRWGDLRVACRSCLDRRCDGACICGTVVDLRQNGGGRGLRPPPVYKELEPASSIQDIGNDLGDDVVMCGREPESPVAHSPQHALRSPPFPARRARPIAAYLVDT